MHVRPVARLDQHVEIRASCTTDRAFDLPFSDLGFEIPPCGEEVGEDPALGLPAYNDAFRVDEPECNAFGDESDDVVVLDGPDSAFGPGSEFLPSSAAAAVIGCEDADVLGVE